MKGIKRVLIVFVVLCIIVLLVFICVHFLSKGYTNEYTVDDYTVTEIYIKSEQDEHDNYYIEIMANNILYNYQFYKKIKDDNKIVKHVFFYDGEYKCLLPVLSDSIKVDFLCYKDSSYYNYADIKGKDEKLDKYIDKVDKDYYNIEDFLDNKDNEKKYDKSKYYENNIPNDYMINMTTLKGIITIINGKSNYVEMSSKDVYKRELGIFSDYYYISADYEEKQEFSNIYIVNLLTGKTKKIKTPDYISFDSYIQGVIDNNVYIYDVNNEKQYKVDIDNYSISEIGNANKGIKYYDGNWSYISSIKANNIELFKDKKFKEKNNYLVYHYGNKLSGFYYYYFKSDDGYEVYRAHSQDKKIKKYLFTIKDKDDVIFVEDYAFFKDNNSIKVYSDYTGIKTLISNDELEFNDNIQFNVYKK